MLFSITRTSLLTFAGATLALGTVEPARGQSSPPGFHTADGEHMGTSATAVPGHEQVQTPIDRGEHLDDQRSLILRRPTGTSPGAIITRGPFVSRQVNIDRAGNNTLGDAANEPSIAIDPASPNLVAIGWRQFDSVDSNFREAGINFSVDGGVNWSAATVLDPGVFRTDPVLDHDHLGNFYYQSLFGLDLTDCDVFRSSDGGANWLEPVAAFGGDKNWMAVDHSTSIGQGNIYCIWREPFSCCGENIFTRSSDGGASYMSPVPVPESPAMATISTDPDGTLFIAGVLEFDFSAFRVARSTNAKNPLLTPTFDHVAEVDLGGALRFFLSDSPNPGGLLGQVWVATDHSGGPTHGNIYVLCSVDPAGPDPLDVHIVRSADAGITWDPPVRINDDDPANNAWQWFGTLSVAPDGRLDVVWNDTRNSGVVNYSELYYAYSTDAGSSWSQNIPVSPSFNSYLGWPNQNKLGDYYHMVSDNAGASLAWAATFNDEQDVYFLRLGDCNENGVHDGVDIAGGQSTDDNANGIPDECECIGDIMQDGVIDVSDLLALLADWGVCPGCPADLDGDGEITVTDLLILLASWGACA